MSTLLAALTAATRAQINVFPVSNLSCPSQLRDKAARHGPEPGTQLEGLGSDKLRVYEENLHVY